MILLTPRVMPVDFIYAFSDRAGWVLFRLPEMFVGCVRVVCLAGFCVAANDRFCILSFVFSLQAATHAPGNSPSHTLRFLNNSNEKGWFFSEKRTE